MSGTLEGAIDDLSDAIDNHLEKIKIDDGGPAFPQLNSEFINRDGMSLRDYFAGAVLQGFSTISDERSCPMNRRHELEIWREETRLNDARYCYEMADAMLQARGK